MVGVDSLGNYRSLLKKEAEAMAKKKASRAKTHKDVESAVLLKSKRRCCLCFGLNNDDAEKEGQIPTLDGNRSNRKEDNLAFLCVRHHSLLDTKTSQHKGLTQGEVKEYRKKLYAHLEEQERKAKDRKEWQENGSENKRRRC